jgi:hypothetical protein
MKTSAITDASSRKGNHQKSPVSPSAWKGNMKDSMAFLKACAREEGICFNDSIWARIKETVSSHAR